MKLLLKRFFAALEKEKLTLSAAARRLAYNSNTIYTWKNGRSVPQFYQIFDICREFGISLGDIQREIEKQWEDSPWDE